MGTARAGIVYTAITIGVYVWTIGAVVTGLMPPYCLIALLTLPFAIKGIQGALNSEDTGKLQAGMANNVITVLATQLLLGIGYLLAGFL